MSDTNTPQLLSSLDTYAPTVYTAKGLPDGINPETINLDRLGEIASADLKKCDALDLLTTVWRGRILAATKEIYQLREASVSYDHWLKRNSLTDKKAEELIRLSNEADELIDKEVISTLGLSRISVPAFTAASVNPEVLGLVAGLAENGEQVDVVTAKRLIDEEKVNSSEIITDEIKEAIIESKIPVSQTARFLEKLEQVNEEQSGELTKTLAESPDMDTLKILIKEATSLVKYLEKAPLVVNCEDIDKALLLSEARKAECLDQMTKTIGYIKSVEELGIKLAIAQKKLSDASDRLFVESGAAHPNLRKLAGLFDSSISEIRIPRGASNDVVVIKLEIEEAVEGVVEEVESEVSGLASKDEPLKPKSSNGQ